MCQTILWSGQGICYKQVAVSFDKREAMCIVMHNEAELMYTFGTMDF